jgi:hypothetical protein
VKPNNWESEQLKNWVLLRVCEQIRSVLLAPQRVHRSRAARRSGQAPLQPLQQTADETVFLLLQTFPRAIRSNTATAAPAVLGACAKELSWARQLSTA